MQLILEDKQKRLIQGKEKIPFASFSSFYLISITVRVKSKKQLPEPAKNDENLIVKINDRTFPPLTTYKDLTKSPAAFSGNKLHDKLKTVYFLTFLKGKNQKITLESQTSATLEGLSIGTLNPDKSIDLTLENQAEDGDRRPWITFVLDNVPLVSVTPTITYARRKRDSDDVKIVIDGKTQGNIFEKIKHFLWRYAGSLLPWTSPTKTATETFSVNLPPNLHYLEFWADRMPTLKTITFDFGTKPSLPEDIPTVDSPKWTGDFYDDNEDILLTRLIFGEAENQPKEAKIGVGFTVINRLKKHQSNWGFTIHEIITKESQYDALWNPDRRDQVRDPLNNASDVTREAWKESYEVAKSILNSSSVDTTNGATHFHSFTEQKDFPPWATEKTFKVKYGRIYFYELEA